MAFQRTGALLQGMKIFLKIIAIIVIILYLVNVNYSFIARHENVLKNYCNYSNNIIPGECQL